MLAIHLLLFCVSSKVIKFEEEKNYTKEELLEKLGKMKSNYGNTFIPIISLECEMEIRRYYPNISFYSCAYFSYVCNKLTPMSQIFTYNETIEIEDSNKLNSLCLDCKTLNYFDAYIEPPEDDCYY